MDLDDARSSDPLELLLEEARRGRSRPLGRRERAVAESVPGLLLLACAVPLAVAAYGAAGWPLHRA